MIAVSWIGPGDKLCRGVVAGWVYNGTACAVVMSDKKFVTVAAHLLTFEGWRD